MIIVRSIGKSLLISLTGHIVLFSIIGFSFGAKIPAAKLCAINFWGAVLDPSDLFNASNTNNCGVKIIAKKETVRVLKDTSKEDFLAQGICLKPQARLSFNEEKLTFTYVPGEDLKGIRAKEPMIIFYPQLPYDMTMYFKDREVVHIELIFNVMPSAGYNSAAIKRRVSSGNLEADLLSMRYISRYLFIQQKGFTPDSWHTVKIDLSTR